MSMEVARAIYRQAREHKMQEMYHRRRMKARMQELENYCKANGIDINVIKEDIANGRVQDPQLLDRQSA